MLKLTIIGVLGNDAEVREHNGQPVINFSVAHTERFKDSQGQQQQRTTWVKCSWWRQQGQTGIVPYLTKGTKVYVEGMPNVQVYTKNDGTTAATIEVRVKELELVGPSNREEQVQQPTQQNHAKPAAKQQAKAYAPADDEDLPF